MATAIPKKGARRDMTFATAPSYFDVQSERARYAVKMPASGRAYHRMPAVGSPGPVRHAGSKLLARFHKTGMRAYHATKPQYPCYGRRSER